MHLIKLDATRSTNEFLKELWQNNDTIDKTVVWALDQYGGRGQQGTTWSSEPGKNLTFSILKEFDHLLIKNQFLLNMAVSTSIYRTLQELGIPNICVKWPNDIMSGNEKLCGVLIENIVKAQKLKAAIIGIGLNVNQVEFDDLPRASSLKSKSGLNYELEHIFNLLINQLLPELDQLESREFHKLKSAYEEVMYRINKVSSFEFPDGVISNGIIRGVTSEGQLLVELDESVRSFGMKEIQLLN